MRQPISPSSRNFAKSFRANSTDAERKLWSLLRAGQLGGLRFKRQVPLDGYILDFVCFEARLIVELDGGQHSGSAADLARDEHFRAVGFHTLRFWNHEVMENLEGVYERLRILLETISPQDQTRGYSSSPSSRVTTPSSSTSSSSSAGIT